jgi:hypothetical protein
MKTERSAPVARGVLIILLVAIFPYGSLSRAGELQAHISGHVFKDTNRNGEQEPDEPDLQGVKMRIIDFLYQTQTITTDDKGDYTATVAVDRDAPKWWLVASGELEAHISGHVFTDTNGDGERGEDEPGLPGVKVRITDSQDHTQTITTDDKGSYAATVPAGQDGPKWWRVVFGAVIVLVCSLQRFNEPRTNRSSTTRVRYVLSMTSYCVVILLVYVVLLRSPTLARRLLSGTEGDEWVKELSAPILSAFLLSVLLPKVPMLNQCDRWLQERLYDLAAIPFEVQRLSAALEDAEFRVPSKLQDDVQARMNAAGFDAADIRLAGSDDPRALWLKAETLMLQLERWRSGQCVSVFKVHGEDYEDLVETQKALAGPVSELVTFLHKHRQDQHDDEMRKIIETIKQKVDGDLKEFLRRIYLFIGRGVLLSGWTGKDRQSRLERAGFSLPAQKPPVDINQITLVVMCVAAALAVAMALSAIASGQQLGLGPGCERLLLVVMVTTIYLLAIVCVVWPKRAWEWAKRRNGRPYAFYLVAGLLAGCGGAMVSFTFSSVLLGSIAEAAKGLSVKWPWILLAASAAFCLAALADNRAKISRIRCVEGAICGLVLALVSRVVVYLLKERVEAIKISYAIPPWEAVMAGTLVIGFILGYFVPHMLRGAPTAWVIGCPNSACRARLRVTADYVGKRARCRRCGRVFVVEESPA